MTALDAGRPTQPETPLEPDRRTWHGLQRRVLAAAAVTPALILTGMNSTVTDLARPFVVSELASDRYRYQWVTGATLLGAVAGYSLIGWMRARFGLKAAWIMGLVIYTFGSLACPVTPNSEFLVLARFVQSWGSGMAVATVQAILWREFPRHRDAALSLYVVGLYSTAAMDCPSKGLSRNARDFASSRVNSSPLLVVGFAADSARGEAAANGPSAFDPPEGFTPAFAIFSSTSGRETRAEDSSGVGAVGPTPAGALHSLWSTGGAFNGTCAARPERDYRQQQVPTVSPRVHQSSAAWDDRDRLSQ